MNHEAIIFFFLPKETKTVKTMLQEFNLKAGTLHLDVVVNILTSKKDMSRLPAHEGANVTVCEGNHSVQNKEHMLEYFLQRCPKD
jgi:hypothetical protein